MSEQLDILVDFLRKEVNYDYVYLDVPGYFNIGDHLIYLGAMRLLETTIPYKCLYKSIIENFNKNKISNDRIIILLQGGGNWGGGYYTPFRNKIIESFPNNKIILLPQTIRYESPSELQNDARKYSKHDNLYLCVRDIFSYEILQKYFISNNIFLLPDTATGLYGILPKHTKRNTNKSLLIRRKDHEISPDTWEIVGAEIKDWDTILDDLHFSKLLWPYQGIRKLRRITGSILLKELCNQYFINIFEPWFFKRIPRYIMNYNKLYTTRLHGFILAKLMEMPVEWQDTKYGKISGYCQTWFPS